MKINVRGSDTPQCFGKYWSEDAAECTVSYDPSTGTQTGEHCDYWTQCMQRTMASRGQIVPQNSLIRPPAGTVARPYGKAQPQPQQPQQAYYGYQQMMPVNYQIPAYLTVREPYSHPRFQRFAVEVGRSLVKSVGHTIAAFADLEAFMSPPMPDVIEVAPPEEKK